MACDSVSMRPLSRNARSMLRLSLTSVANDTKPRACPLPPAIGDESDAQVAGMTGPEAEVASKLTFSPAIARVTCGSSIDHATSPN